jgi:hypothetical protein
VSCFDIEDARKRVRVPCFVFVLNDTAADPTPREAYFFNQQGRFSKCDLNSGNTAFLILYHLLVIAVRIARDAKGGDWKTLLKPVGVWDALELKDAPQICCARFRNCIDPDLLWRAKLFSKEFPIVERAVASDRTIHKKLKPQTQARLDELYEGSRRRLQGLLWIDPPKPKSGRNPQIAYYNAGLFPPDQIYFYEQGRDLWLPNKRNSWTDEDRKRLGKIESALERRHLRIEKMIGLGKSQTEGTVAPTLATPVADDAESGIPSPVSHPTIAPSQQVPDVAPKARPPAPEFQEEIDEVVLKEIDSYLKQPKQFRLNLYGRDGAGKTQWARKTALAIADRFPDGVFEIDEEEGQWPDGLRRILREIGVKIPNGPDEWHMLYSLYLDFFRNRKKRALIIVKNQSREFASFADLPSNCGVIYTTFMKKAEKKELSYEISPLSPEKAKALAMTFGSCRPGLEKHVEILTEQCRRNPLAIKHAVSVIAHGAQHALDSLINMYGFFYRKYYAIGENNPVLASLDFSYTLLLPEHQVVWRSLAAFSVSVTESEVTRLVNTLWNRAVDVASILLYLEKSGRIHRDQMSRIQLHHAERSFLSGRMESSDVPKRIVLEYQSDNNPA